MACLEPTSALTPAANVIIRKAQIERPHHNRCASARPPPHLMEGKVPFLTTQRIKDLLDSEESPIPDADLTHVNNACYEMALGDEAFITSSNGTKTHFEHNGQIRIPPGQFGLLITRERLHLPQNLLAFISIKASKKMTGLVNVSGFHVDPGFEGRLKFSVYNAGSESTVLDVGKPLFPIWFYELREDNEDDYDGIHKGQMSITADDVARLQGEVASPAELKRQIDEIRATVKHWQAVTTSVVGGAIITAITAVIALIR